MMKTIAVHRKSASARRSYRRRVKFSKCRGLKPSICLAKDGCKMSRGKKRSFCRKSKSTRRR
jgi:hypothetical protein